VSNGGGERATVTITIEVERITPGKVLGSDVEHAFRRYIKAKTMIWAGDPSKQHAYRVLSVDSDTVERTRT
jgi:hypothetical protein